MATVTGYKIILDTGAVGPSVGDDLSGGTLTQTFDTSSYYPLGTGVVNYPTTAGDVEGTFYEIGFETYFVPNDTSSFPTGETGDLTSFADAIYGTINSEAINGTSDGEYIQDTDVDLYWTTGDDTINAGGGDDTILFGDGNDTIYGGDGNDVIGDFSYGSGTNTLYGEAGDDTIIGGGGNDTIYGGTGDDWLSGGEGYDTLDGGDGSDEIWVTDNHDASVIIGGEGGSDWDTLGFSNYESSQGVTVTFSGHEAGSYDFVGTSGTGSFTEIEQVITTEYADTIDGTATSQDLVISANGGDDVIYGGSGDDQIYGGAGADTMSGGAGTDTLIGDDGNDVFQIEDDDDTTNVDGGGWWDKIEFSNAATTQGVTVTYTGDEAGTYSFDGSSASGTFADIEEFHGTQDYGDTIDASADTSGIQTYTFGGDDNVIGGSGDDRIYLNEGDDTASGGIGNDQLFGEDGEDTLTGGAGDDDLTGGAGDDTYVFAGGSGNDTILDFDMGDSDSDGFTNDQLDVSALTDDMGNPVDIGDVVVTDDGSGNAVLTFPNGESITLVGVSPASVTAPSLVSMGVPCLTTGTLIRTPSGDRVVEGLRVGDLVTTADNGPQPVLWLGQTHLSSEQLKSRPKSRPILIERGALGNTRRLLVSPQHGMVLRINEQGDQLVRAVHLAKSGGPGFRVAHGVQQVTYVHLMFAEHQIIFAENARTESFYPGPMGLAALSKQQRKAAFQVLPELMLGQVGLAAYGPPALPLCDQLSLRQQTHDRRKQTVSMRFKGKSPSYETCGAVD